MDAKRTEETGKIETNLNVAIAQTVKNLDLEYVAWEDGTGRKLTNTKNGYRQMSKT